MTRPHLCSSDHHSSALPVTPHSRMASTLRTPTLSSVKFRWPSAGAEGTLQAVKFHVLVNYCTVSSTWVRSQVIQLSVRMHSVSHSSYFYYYTSFFKISNPVLGAPLEFQPRVDYGYKLFKPSALTLPLKPPNWIILSEASHVDYATT